MIATRAHAKVNLALAVIGRRADGFHDLVSVFARLDLADELTVESTTGPDRIETADGSIAHRPAADDLVLQAASLLRTARAPGASGLTFRLTKHVPLAAGLGGGSADAAAALDLAARAWGLALTDDERQDLAARLGSDVPFFAADVDAALVTGRGEHLEPLPGPLDPVGVLLLTSGTGLVTRAVFESWMALDASAGRAAHDADAALAARELAAALAAGCPASRRGGHGRPAARRQRPVARGDPSPARPRRPAAGPRSAARPAAPALGFGSHAARSVSFEGGRRRRGDRAPVRSSVRRARCGDPVGDLRAHHDEGGRMNLERIATDGAPAAIGPYSQAIVAGDMVFCSGQLGLDPATGELADGVAAQAERALANLGAVLEAAGCTYADVAKVTVFLADIADFPTLNTVYATFFGAPPPARSTFAVSALPKGGLVEIEAIAVRRPRG